MTGIVSYGVYIPKYRIKVEDISKAQGKKASEIKKSLNLTEKSLPSIDEDTVTMAVEASRSLFDSADISPEKVGAIYIGSESHPYAVKPTSTIVGSAVGCGNNYTAADFEFACKAGTAAIQAGYGLVKSKVIDFALCGGSDTAQSAPGDILEFSSAAGSAMFLIGREKVIATINETMSYSSDTPDFWRKNKEKFPSHAGSFTGEPAYFKHIMGSANILLDRLNKKPKDYDYVVFHQPNGKFPMRVAKRLGFTKEQVEPGFVVDKIGNTYSASSLIGLAAVLDIAKPLQKILLISYGSGAGSDAFDITTTSLIEKHRPGKTVDELIKDKIYVDYVNYLKNTGKIDSC